jgi:hypothetical protein
MGRTRRFLLVASATAAMVIGGAGSAFAFGGPNEAGNSGHFHPNSNPCASDNDHPHCPGPH